MPNVKISALTAATTVSGTDQVAIVQSGVTKRATRDQLQKNLKVFLPYDPRDYGAPNNGTSDDGPGIQAALDAAAADGAQIVQLPLTTNQVWITNQQIKVPNKVILRGQGRGAITLRAGGSFPTTTALVRLGKGTGLCFGCRVEELMLDCNDVVGSIGVWSTEAQEKSGLWRVAIMRYRDRGVHMAAGSSSIALEHVECFGSNSGATYGIVLEAYGQNLISNTTVISYSGTGILHTADIYIHNSQAVLVSIHVECGTYGVDIDGNSGVSINGISGPSSSATVTYVVRMRSNNRYCVVLNSVQGAATHNVRDELFTGLNYDDFYIPFFSMGDAHMMRLRHHGDQVGFYNAPPVGQPATGGASATFVANAGTAVNDASTFDGYTVKQVVKALRNLGLLT